MTLKLSMKHKVLQCYLDYSNDDLELTLTYFMAWSTIGKDLYIKFHGMFYRVSLKMILKTFLNEYMKICENKRSRSSFDI